jgi:hypothetical protein
VGHEQEEEGAYQRDDADRPHHGPSDRSAARGPRRSHGDVREVGGRRAVREHEDGEDREPPGDDRHGDGGAGGHAGGEDEHQAPDEDADDEVATGVLDEAVRDGEADQGQTQRRSEVVDECAAGGIEHCGERPEQRAEAEQPTHPHRRPGRPVPGGSRGGDAGQGSGQSQRAREQRGSGHPRQPAHDDDDREDAEAGVVHDDPALRGVQRRRESRHPVTARAGRRRTARAHGATMSGTASTPYGVT